MTLINLHSMLSSHHRQRLQNAVRSLLLGTVLVGCEAQSQPSPSVQKTPEPKSLSVETCTSIKTQDEMIKCFEDLGVQQNAEIAELDKANEFEAEKGKRLDERVEDLTKESEEAWERLEDRILEPER